MTSYYLSWENRISGFVAVVLVIGLNLKWLLFGSDSTPFPLMGYYIVLVGLVGLLFLWSFRITISQESLSMRFLWFSAKSVNIKDITGMTTMEGKRFNKALIDYPGKYGKRKFVILTNMYAHSENLLRDLEAFKK